VKKREKEIDRERERERRERERDERERERERDQIVVVKKLRKKNLTGFSIFTERLSSLPLLNPCPFV
jgi:hypothetical protein